jgi:hypothetical protein
VLVIHDLDKEFLLVNYSLKHFNSFVTTVQPELPKNELIPQYSVDYVAVTKVGQVRVKAKNWRRNVTVEVDGSADAVKAAYGRMIWTGLQGAV